MVNSKRDILLTLLFCSAVSCLVFYDTASYPQVQGQGFGQGPAFYPRLLAGGLVILAIVAYVMSKIQPEQIQATPVSRPVEDSHCQRRPLLPLTVFLLICGFIFCLKWSGFLFGGFVLVSTTCLTIYRPFSKRSILVSLFAGVVIIFLVWLIFSFFIGIDLPGPWFME